MDFISELLIGALGLIMKFCYSLIGNYGISIILFTLITKLILIPLNIVIQQNSIKMVKLLPEQNALKIKYIDDKDKFTDEQIALYKKHKYNPTIGVLPLLIQIPLVLGLVGVIYRPLSYVIGLDGSIIESLSQWFLTITENTELSDMFQIEVLSLIQSGTIPLLPEFNSAINEIQALDVNFCGLNLGMTPSLTGNFELISIPVLSGLSALLLCVAQNKFNVLQLAQGKLNKYGTTIFMVAFSTYFAFLVPAGVGLYWIFGNLFAIPSMLLVNLIIPPKKYVDFKYLNEMQEQRKLKETMYSKYSKKEKEDYKRFTKLENKRIMFYSEHNGFYKYYADIIDYICENSDFIIDYVTSDPEDDIFKCNNPQIRSYYVARDKYLIPLFMKLDCDICVMTMPDLEKYHIKRSRVRNDIEYIYVSHGMGSSSLTLRKGALDWYDTIFSVGPDISQEIREMEELYGTKKKIIVETGYALLDSMLREYNEANHKKNDIPKILIAPSWQPDNIIDLCAEHILNILSKSKFEVILRAHPQQVRHEPERFENFKKKYAEFNNIEVQTNFSSNSPVLEADVLITDWSDISMEYAFVTKKPVLFIDTPMKIMNNEYDLIKTVPRNIIFRNIIGKSIELNQIDDIESFLNEMILNQDKYKERITNTLNEYTYNIGKCGILSGKYIIKRLKNRIK